MLSQKILGTGRPFASEASDDGPLVPAQLPPLKEQERWPMWPYSSERGRLIHYLPSQEVGEILLKKEVDEMLNQLIGAAVVANQRFGGGGVGSTMQPQRQWLSPCARQRISIPQRRDVRDLGGHPQATIVLPASVCWLAALLCSCGLHLRRPLRFPRPAAGCWRANKATAAPRSTHMEGNGGSRVSCASEASGAWEISTGDPCHSAGGRRG